METGFQNILGPVRIQPRLAIISYNPGGDEENFEDEDLMRFERGDFTAPSGNTYMMKNHTMSRKLQRFFLDHERILEESVVFPLLFFRSKNVKLWGSELSKEKRKEMELFCYAKVKEIMEIIKPKVLLVLGFSTYDKLKKHILTEIKNEKEYTGTRKPRISLTASWNYMSIFCMIHPTGAHGVTKEDFDKNRYLFFRFIESKE